MQPAAVRVQRIRDIDWDKLEGVTALKRRYIGLVVFTVALIASTGLYIDHSWTYEFHVTSFLSVQQEETAAAAEKSEPI